MSIATDVRMLDYGNRALQRARYQPLTRQRIDKLGVTPDHAVVKSGNIDIVDDGADLAEVARATGLGIDGVVAAHTGASWRVAFGGFSPGFADLVGGDPRLEVPGWAGPRTRVPAGSVALAGEFSRVYPRESPGGGPLSGRIRAPLRDIEGANSALLTPGMSVQFRALS